MMDKNDQERGKQPVHGFPAVQLAEINDQIQALLGERLPRRMPREISWEFWATAMLARVGAIFDSISVLISAKRRADAEVALRTLFEQVTVFCWIAIEPNKHLTEWQEHSEFRWAQFYEEAREDYGIELISAEDAEALARKRMRTLELRTEAIDDYWPRHLEAFRGPATRGQVAEELPRPVHRALSHHQQDRSRRSRRTSALRRDRRGRHHRLHRRASAVRSGGAGDSAGGFLLTGPPLSFRLAPSRYGHQDQQFAAL